MLKLCEELAIILFPCDAARSIVRRSSSLISLPPIVIGTLVVMLLHGRLPPFILTSPNQIQQIAGIESGSTAGTADHNVSRWLARCGAIGAGAGQYMFWEIAR
jgi:hypothetical protein